jgi:hypothetical protein
MTRYHKVIAHAKRRYINTHNLFLGCGLRYADEERDNVVSPAQILSTTMTGGVMGANYLLICSAISVSNVNNQKQNPT